jgi:hypothetical protein
MPSRKPKNNPLIYMTFLILGFGYRPIYYGIHSITMERIPYNYLKQIKKADR